MAVQKRVRLGRGTLIPSLKKRAEYWRQVWAAGHLLEVILSTYTGGYVPSYLGGQEQRQNLHNYYLLH